MVSKTKLLSKNADFLATEMDGEIVMMNTEDGTYFSLSAGVGAHIWDLLDTPKSIEELSEMISSAFDVKPEKCHADVAEYVKSLLKQKILIAAS